MDTNKKLEGLQLTETSKNRIKKQLIEKYNKVSKELEEYRDCSSLKDGCGTSVLAKKQRKADELSKEKSIIRDVLFNDWNVEV